MEENMNDMKIRMIFCDVDGTLLPHGENSISDDVFNTINLAVSSGVHFCIASGRSYSDLNKLFYPVRNDIIFIPSDGALGIKHDTVLFSSPLNKPQVACMSKTYSRDYEALLIYTKDFTFFISEAKHFDFAKKIIPDEVLSITGDVYKVAFYNLSQKAKIKLDNLGIKSGILNKVYEDNLWTEFISAQTDKGSAAQKLQHLLGISISETAAFGDNLNDINMLRRAQYSFAPKNAHHEIIKMCKHTTNNVNNEILNMI